MTSEEAVTKEEHVTIWNRLMRRFSETKRSLLERTRPHKTLYYWVKKAFDELRAIRILRFIVQLIAFLLLFYAGIVFVLGFDPLLNSFFAGVGYLIPIFGFIPVPYDMPHGIAQGTATGFFDIIMLLGQAGIFPFIALGVLLIVPVLVGRSFCGWICPFGFVQDICSMTPIRTRYPSRKTDRTLSRIKYIILFIILFFVTWVGIWTFLGIQQELTTAIGPFATAFWAVLSPSATLFVIIPYLIVMGVVSPIFTQWLLPPFVYPWYIFWIRIGFLFIIIFIALFIRRPYCRWICPVGAILGLVGQFSFLTVSLSSTECRGGACDSQTCKKACPVGISVMEQPYGAIHSAECILCLECVSKCDHDAVKVEFG